MSRFAVYKEKTMKQDKNKRDFPTTDEEMREFLETTPPVKVPKKYEKPDWLFEELTEAITD